MKSETIVVVGGSLAGGRAAEALRRGGYEGRIVVVGADPHRPYDRPPLSKKYLRGQVPEEKLFLRAGDWYEQQRIELVTGTRALRLRETAREVDLEDGRSLAFDRLIIATGADVRPLTCEGASLEGVCYLRTLDDAKNLRARLAPGKRVVVIGAGVIGAEVAASCREESLEVVMLEAQDTPLVRAFGPEIGRLYAEEHRARGVDLRCGTMVRALRGAGRVEEVELSTGERIGCDFVLAGIGVSPAVGWLEGSGVAIDGGVLTDERGRTSVPGIYAAGDVARAWSGALDRHVCVESVDNAQTQAVTVAQDILGKDTAHSAVPFFWSDQYDLKLQSVGFVGEYDQVVFRGSVEARKLAAFHLLDGTLRFTVAINRLKEIGISKKLIAAGTPVSADTLADESFDLASLR